MRHEPVLGHDPSGHLLRDTGSELGLDPAVPVTTLGRGERIGHLPHQRVLQLQFLDPAAQRLHVTVIARGVVTRGLDSAPPSCASFPFLGGNAAMPPSRYALTQ